MQGQRGRARIYLRERFVKRYEQPEEKRRVINLSKSVRSLKDSDVVLLKKAFVHLVEVWFLRNEADGLPGDVLDYWELSKRE